jgi:hypothetical protein
MRRIFPGRAGNIRVFHGQNERVLSMVILKYRPSGGSAFLVLTMKAFRSGQAGGMYQQSGHVGLVGVNTLTRERYPRTVRNRAKRRAKTPGNVESHPAGTKLPERRPGNIGPRGLRNPHAEWHRTSR